MKYDLAVAYRIYPGVSKVPPVYPHDKLQLARFCLESFHKALEGITVKMYVLLDGCPEEYTQLFLEFFPKEDLVFIPLSKEGNKKTFERQIEILTTQEDADTIYFAEDDYFYIKNLKPILDVIRAKKADFISPYEHPSCYTDDHKVPPEKEVFENQTYIHVQHACLTFMASKESLLQNKKIFQIYSNWFASDYTLWSIITLGRDFFKYTPYLGRIAEYTMINLKVFGTMVMYGFLRFLTNRKYILLMPVGTFATHLESNFLSPGVNWDTYFNGKN